MTREAILNHVKTNGFIKPSSFKSVERWEAVIKRLKREEYGLDQPATIKSERYGLGSRWYCTRCDAKPNYFGIQTITYTNSTPPKSCPKCGGVST